MMIDVETLSTRNNAVMLSIGVVVFDTDIEATFSAVASDVDDQAERGAHVQPSTALWWMRQSDLARQQFRNGIPTVKILEQVAYLWTKLECSKVWSYGSTYDISIIENLYRLYSIQVPWSYKNVMCHRTLVSLFPHIQRDLPEVSHDALEDAVSQAKTCMKILRTIS